MGPAKAVNRLLGVTDQEQAARPGNRLRPDGGEFFGGKGEDDLGLQRVGVLEFVDEDVAVAHAQGPADRGVFAH